MNAKEAWKLRDRQKRLKNRLNEAEAEQTVMRLMRTLAGPQTDPDDPMRPPKCDRCQGWHIPEAGC